MTDDEVVSGSGLVLPQSLLQRYHVQRMLGHGGYGSVFLARDVIIGRLVALKVLNKGLIAHEVIYNHFIQEARIAGQLDHENIVVIYNVEEHTHCACIVMEYLAEGNLAVRIKEENFSVVDALRVICGILDGLSVAHRMKVIHRDIKPENILFDPKGRAKVSDFGIAHLPKDEGGVHGKNEFNPVGTPSYMAPEQLRGDKKIDSRADLYSTGAILYEMLSGSRAYKFPKGMSFPEIAKFIDRTPYTPIQELNSNVSDDFAAIVDRLLHKDRNERYSTAMEVLNDITNLENQAGASEGNTSNDDQLYTSPEALLEDVMRLLLVDGIMSPPERRELNKRAERLKVSADKARLMENRIRREMGLPSLETLEEYQAAVTLMAGGGFLSNGQKEELRKASGRLGIKDIERAMIELDALEQQSKGTDDG